MQCSSITFSGHALQRMFARGIVIEDVKWVLGDHEVVAEYPDDKPYSSRLLLGWKGERADKQPLHVVVAQNHNDYACYIVTAYVPASELWHDDFKTRRS